MSGGGLSGIGHVLGSPNYLGNSITGGNVGGKGGMSNDPITRAGNNIFGLNLFNAGNNSLDAQKAAAAAANPSTLPNLGPTSMNPHFFSPNSFVQRQPNAPGIYNAMAAQLAGPQYDPTRMGQQPNGAAQSGAMQGAGTKGTQMAPMLQAMMNQNRAHPIHGGFGGMQ